MNSLKVLAFSLIAFMLLTAESCTSQSSQDKGSKTNEGIMERALNNEPTYVPDNFLTRKYTNRWIEVMDSPSKTFYIYVMAPMGQFIGYYIAEYRPISTATYLTPPKKEYHTRGSGANPLGPAPALDGTYYGSGGASDQYFFFDVATGAFIEIKGLPYIITDQPLSIDAPQLKVKKE